ncbi:MAG: hypothetical protein ACLVJH_01280 [Faecalibacterium prausnitzii]
MQLELTLPEALEAPVEQGQTVGKAQPSIRGSTYWKSTKCVPPPMRRCWTVRHRLAACCGRACTGQQLA